MDVKTLLKTAKQIGEKRAMKSPVASPAPAGGTPPTGVMTPGAAAPAMASAVPAAKPPAAPLGPMGAKVAYVTENGTPLFTIDQAVEVISKAAGLLLESEQKSAAKSAAYDESVEYVREMMQAARQIGDTK